MKDMIIGFLLGALVLFGTLFVTEKVHALGHTQDQEHNIPEILTPELVTGTYQVIGKLNPNEYPTYANAKDLYSVIFYKHLEDIHFLIDMTIKGNPEVARDYFDALVKRGDVYVIPAYDPIHVGVDFIEIKDGFAIYKVNAWLE